ncbi:putative reverse transcriptase domain-containing protein [Tanacetum coccineum]
MPSLADPNAVTGNRGECWTVVYWSTVSESGPDVSFASLLKGDSKGKGLNFHTFVTQAGNGADVAVPLESICAVSESFMDGLDSMLENGQWFVRNNPLILKKWNPDVNLMKEDVVNVPVWVKLHGVHVAEFTEDGLSSIATNIRTPLMLDSYTSDMCIQSWGRSSYARSLIEIRANVELKDTVAMLKLTREAFYTCIVCVEYDWKPPRFACCKVFGHIHEECPKNLGLGTAKNLKKPSQASRGVPGGLKVGFKPTKEYKPIAKKPTANTSGNKKKDVEPTKKNVETSSTSTTPIVDKIGKLEKLIIEGKVTLVDDDEMVGFGTKSLLEQWTDSYENGDYDEDPYDDDIYEGHDLFDKLQDICDNLDIRVRGEDVGLTLILCS